MSDMEKVCKSEQTIRKDLIQDQGSEDDQTRCREHERVSVCLIDDSHSLVQCQISGQSDKTHTCLIMYVFVGRIH